jgi:hypothetical protein
VPARIERTATAGPSAPWRRPGVAPLPSVGYAEGSPGGRSGGRGSGGGSGCGDGVGSGEGAGSGMSGVGGGCGICVLMTTVVPAAQHPETPDCAFVPARAA